MKNILPYLICTILMIFSGCKSDNSKTLLITYTELSDGFYLGSDHKMYIKTNEVGEDGNRADTSFFREIPFIDIKTFEKWKADGWYAKDKNHVYIDHSMTDGRHIWALEEADAQSFKAIGYRWGTDKNHVFENGIILNGLNPDSMVVLCPETTAYKEVFFSMVKDSKHVFWGHDEMSGTDPGSFNCKCTPSKDGTFPGAVSYYDKNWIYNENYFPNMDLKDRTKK